MPISGYVAGGASEALEEVLDRRLKEQIRQQQEQEHADQVAHQRQQIELQQQSQADLAADRAAGRAQQQKVFDLADLTRREAAADRATQKAALGDMGAVLQMPGMTPQQMQKEVIGSSLRTGTEIPRPVVDLLKVPEDKKHAVTVPGPGGVPTLQMIPESRLEQGGVQVYREPKTPATPPQKHPEWVQLGDGTVVDLNAVAPPGSKPITATISAKQAADMANNDRALTAMKSYGDDMLSVIDNLIDDKGKLKPGAASVIGGMGGALPEWAYASEEGQSALADIDRLQSMLNINTLRELKSQSRTGASGFGALSEKELGVIESSASKLRRRRQAENVYADELLRIRNAIKANRGGGGGGTDGGGGGTPKQETAAEKIKRLSGG
jgi:hypothetical protein